MFEEVNKAGKMLQERLEPIHPAQVDEIVKTVGTTVATIHDVVNRLDRIVTRLESLFKEPA